MDMEDAEESDKFKRLQTLKLKLHEIEEKLLPLSKAFDLLEGDSTMVTCSINNQHKVHKSNVKYHEEKCDLHSQGYNESDRIFPEYSGFGSCISLTSQLISAITKDISSELGAQNLKSVPQTSADFDQNFKREEKLAIYDYVIANTKKQKTFSDLLSLMTEKKEEQREKSVWEIAAAERDAKRRRASYRNKVNSNCKTHTEILREVIDVQMGMLKEEIPCEKSNEENKKSSEPWKKRNTELQDSDDRRKSNKFSFRRNEEDESRKKHYSDRYRNKNSSKKRSRDDSNYDSGSRSRSRDQCRKWKTGEGRSHFHKSRCLHDSCAEVFVVSPGKGIRRRTPKE